jgi:hypothetical protein
LLRALSRSLYIFSSTDRGTNNIASWDMVILTTNEEDNNKSTASN